MRVKSLTNKMKLSIKEQQVLQTIKLHANKRDLTNSFIYKKSRICKSHLSIVVNSLQKKGFIEIKKKGRENKINLL